MRFSLNQIQAVVEIARCGFHVSKAARHLNTSQSVTSKHLKSFEDQLGRKIFVRTGKRLTGVTPEGEKILVHADRVLQGLTSIEKIAVEANSSARETLSLATSPTLARYLLTHAVKRFTQMHPEIHLNIQVEESDKAVETVLWGKCDFAIAPVGKSLPSELSAEVLLEWSRLLIGTPDCPLFAAKSISLEEIAAEPIIAFETPTVSLREIFEHHGLSPNLALTTSNPDVMKAYAAQGLGVAIVATPTFDAARDAPLVARDASHLFPNVKIAAVHKKDSYRTVAQQSFLDCLSEAEEQM